MTAIYTALSEAPKADVVNFALNKADECHDLKRANADLKRRMRAMAIAAVIGMVLAFTLGRGARAGDALVIDGDTIAMDGRTIRLWGIDAPEIRQTCTSGDGARYRCGIAAARALEDLIIARDVTCARKDTDRYGRIVAICSTPEIPDIGAAMVRAGHAVDYVRYSRGFYASQESGAMAEHRGIWNGGFENPETWRHDPRNHQPFQRR